MEHIKIPVVRDFGREVMLRLPSGEEVSINKEDVDLLGWGVLFGGTATLTFKSHSDLSQKYEILCSIIRAGGSALIPIELADKGSTEKNRKVRVSGVVYRIPHPENYIEDHKEHTITIPASSIVEHGGQHFAPRWLLKKTIHQRVLEGELWPDEIMGGVWFGADDLWESLFATAEEEMERQAEQVARFKAGLAAAIAEERREKMAHREARRQAEAKTRETAA